MFSIYLLFVSLLIIKWTFRFMYRCICGRTFYVTIYVKSVIMYDLQNMLNCKIVWLCLEVSELIFLLFTPKFSRRSIQVLRACLYWENNRILSSTKRGGYWERFIVVFHSHFNRIITIISTDLAECGLLYTEIHIL